MKASDLAGRLGLRVAGDGNVEVTGVAPLERATPSDLSFLANPKYREMALASKAGAILAAESAALPGKTLLLCRDPYLALARALEFMHPAVPVAPGCHRSAVLGEGCRVAEDASVGPYAVLGDHCSVGSRTVISAGVVVGSHSTIGSGCRLHPRVVLYDRTVLGDRVILHAGVVVGSDGFGYAHEDGHHVKVPQVGRVVIEDDVEVGANCTIDRGALEETRIGRGTKIDNLVQIAHNVRVGADCILVAQAGISGSTELGRGVIFAGQSGAVGHIRIGDGARIGAKSAVTKDLPDGAFVTGHPAQDHRAWLKERALCGKLDEMMRRIKALEAKAAGGPKEEDA
jgi:UDP-3-O-[3-hydroxymyristoyl] glucosamine N-acyltransferase